MRLVLGNRQAAEDTLRVWHRQFGIVAIELTDYNNQFNVFVETPDGPTLLDRVPISYDRRRTFSNLDQTITDAMDAGWVRFRDRSGHLYWYDMRGVEWIA